MMNAVIQTNGARSASAAGTSVVTAAYELLARHIDGPNANRFLYHFNLLHPDVDSKPRVEQRIAVLTYWQKQLRLIRSRKATKDLMSQVQTDQDMCQALYAVIVPVIRSHDLPLIGDNITA